MQELPHPWAEYARLQAIAAKSSKIDSHSWGLEAAMNALLSKPERFEAADIRRDRDTAARRERFRKRSRRIYQADIGGRITDPVVRMEARQALELIRLKVTPTQWQLLSSVGEGTKLAEFASTQGLPAGSVRTQLCRLRHQLLEYRHAA